MALSKGNVKYINSLRLKKFRQKYNNFIVEGDKMARELLSQQPGRIKNLYAVEGWMQEHSPGAVLPAEKIQLVSESELKAISNLRTPNQVLLIVAIENSRLDPARLAGSLALYLDGIQDPGNFGAILRIADWFGIEYVLCAQNCVDPYNAKAVQASMGAFLRVRPVEIELADALQRLPGFPVYGAAMDGENIFRIRGLKEEGLIVIGNEGNGISSAAERLLTRRVAIPAAAHSGAESLNAAIATGIICAVFRELAG